MTASSNGQQLNSLHVSIDAIQYSHDLLNAILNDDLPVSIEDIMDVNDETMIEMGASMSVLCWLLGHDNPIFRDNMVGLEQALDDAGIEFVIEPNE